MCDEVYSKHIKFPMDTIFYKFVRKFTGKYYAMYVRTEIPFDEWIIGENINPQTFPESRLTSLHLQTIQPFRHVYHNKVKGFSAFRSRTELKEYENKSGFASYGEFGEDGSIIAVECHFRGKIVKAAHRNTDFFLGREIRLVCEIPRDEYQRIF